MAMFSITVTNRDFSSRSSFDTPDTATARSHALKGALEIGSEEVCNGKAFFGAEVEVEDDQGATMRYVVAIGASPLQ